MALAHDSIETSLVRDGLGVRSVTRLIRVLLKKKLMTTGLAVLLVIAFTAVFADVIAPFHYTDTDTDAILQSPNLAHPFGTDSVGQDTLSRVIYGSRIALGVGAAVSVIAVVLALSLGLSSVLYGGWYDLLLQRLVDAWMCFPFLIIILTAVAVFGPGLYTIILVLGVSGSFRMSRIVRSAALRENSSVYVEAAHAMGASKTRIAVRHLFPNVVPVVIVLGSLSMALAIITEASLSFLGYGVPPPVPSWGLLLGGQSREFMLVQPWLGVFPGLALTAAVWSINVIGDGLRDLLDPRLRGQG